MSDRLTTTDASIQRTHHSLKFYLNISLGVIGPLGTGTVTNTGADTPQPSHLVYFILTKKYLLC